MSDYEMLSTARVAAEYGLSEATLRRYRSDGGGPPHVRLGALVRYRRADVEQWIAALPTQDPRSQCPRCGAWVEDLDGMGVIYHAACGYCRHPAGDEIRPGVMLCDVCGETIRRD